MCGLQISVSEHLLRLQPWLVTPISKHFAFYLSAVESFLAPLLLLHMKPFDQLSLLHCILSFLILDH